MKKLINRAEDVVKEELEGMAAAHAGQIKVHFDPDYILRGDAPIQGKVGIISGSGSGHEPVHGGYVGIGMLDAACPGAVFTSPTSEQILAATRAVDGGIGVLQIVMNYTGDLLNFEMAADLARDLGIAIETVVIDDDVAVQDSLYTTGRRGGGVIVLAEKISGAAAEQHRPLREVTRICRKVNSQGRSMAMALTSCIMPQVGWPTLDLPEDEMELGIGIHGEPGRSRLPLKTAAEITALLAGPVLEDLPFKRGDTVLAFVNGMGGTPLIELYVVYNELAKICAGRGIRIARSLVGPYMTSLEMAGCSVTLLKMDEELLQLWDAPVRTPGLRWGL